MGERSPRWNEKAKGAFIGLSMEHTTGDMLRSVMEGVAMNLSLILETYRREGATVSDLVLIGGGARNEIWRQILADVLNVNIHTPNYLEEATSMGAAITAGVGVGVFKDFQVIDKFLKTEGTYLPNEENRRFYENFKKAFDDSYFSLEKTFETIYNMI